MYTGERAVPQTMLNVTVRQGAAVYRFLAELARGKDVLDVACGEGYGTALLAETARSVLGADRDPAIVAHARARYRKETLSFLCADAFELPKLLGNRRFDVVCSFQFLEHLQEQTSFLRLLCGLAAPGGVVAVSTPNKRVFPTFNPYHVREVDLGEFRALLSAVFSRADIYGVFGDADVLRYRASKQRLGDVVLRADVLRFREWLPRPLRQRVYDVVSFLIMKRVSFWRNRELVNRVSPASFSVRPDALEQALDFLALATVPVEVPARAPAAPEAVSVADVTSAARRA